MVRKLKFHEQKLLKKVDFINWEVDNNLHEVKVLRKYHIEKREDYTKWVKKKITTHVYEYCVFLWIHEWNASLRIKRGLWIECFHNFSLDTTSLVEISENWHRKFGTWTQKMDSDLKVQPFSWKNCKFWEPVSICCHKYT